MTLCSYDANSDQNVTATNKFYFKNIILFIFKCYAIKYDKITYLVNLYTLYTLVL